MIAIVDYGLGNLGSVSNALDFLGIDSMITNDIGQIEEASHMILPGVGAFGKSMEGLCKTGLDKCVKKFIKSKKPFLGICVGMQMLFDYSDEMGRHSGLSLIPGGIEHLPEGVSVPHIGWNEIEDYDAGMFKGIRSPVHMYFANSYCCADTSLDCCAGITDYGIYFTSAIVKDNIWAVQFHPEKSGEAGLKMLTNFCSQ